MPKLHDPVRFDADAWAAVCREADRLGVPRALFIRDAVHARVVRLEHHTELQELASRVERAERGLTIALTALRRLTHST